MLFAINGIVAIATEYDIPLYVDELRLRNLRLLRVEGGYTWRAQTRGVSRNTGSLGCRSSERQPGTEEDRSDCAQPS